MIKIATFNLRCLWDGDGINSFIHRIGLIDEKISTESPDVIAFQEMTDKHLSVLRRLMTEYEFIGASREADYSGEGVYTALRKRSMKLLGFDFFWLSPTPNIPGSVFDNQSDCRRVCTTLKLLHISSGEVFRIINTHLELLNEAVRMDEMQQLVKYIAEKHNEDGLPTVFMGDFNALPEEPAIELCKTYMEDVTKDISVTFHGFGTTAQKIDYIFVSKNLVKRIADVNVWDDTRNGIYLSDHYPVCVELEE